jgi:hypothetical protein
MRGLATRRVGDIAEGVYQQVVAATTVVPGDCSMQHVCRRPGHGRDSRQWRSDLLREAIWD